MKKSHRLSGIILIALVLTVATFAFAAANTVPPSNAGDGTGVISGYTVTNVNYILNGANPSLIETVTFTINPAPPAATGDVEIQLDGTTWITCTNTAGSVSCPVAGSVTALAAANLRVVAAD